MARLHLHNISKNTQQFAITKKHTEFNNAIHRSKKNRADKMLRCYSLIYPSCIYQFNERWIGQNGNIQILYKMKYHWLLQTCSFQAINFKVFGSFLSMHLMLTTEQFIFVIEIVFFILQIPLSPPLFSSTLIQFLSLVFLLFASGRFYCSHFSAHILYKLQTTQA